MYLLSSILSVCLFTNFSSTSPLLYCGDTCKPLSPKCVSNCRGIFNECTKYAYFMFNKLQCFSCRTVCRNCCHRSKRNLFPENDVMSESYGVAAKTKLTDKKNSFASDNYEDYKEIDDPPTKHHQQYYYRGWTMCEEYTSGDNSIY